MKSKKSAEDDIIAILALPLDDFFQQAWDLNKYVMQGKRARYRTPLWEFVRLCKGHPELKDLSGAQALERVRNWMLITWRASWEDVFEEVQGEEDAVVEFLRLWDIIRFVPGYGPLEAALEMAKKAPLKLNSPRTPGYTQFISLASCLQSLRPSQSIQLPCHKLAELLRCSPQTISQYRRWGVDDGFLRVVKGHSYSMESHRGDATEFRFIYKPAKF